MMSVSQTSEKSHKARSGLRESVACVLDITETCLLLPHSAMQGCNVCESVDRSICGHKCELEL